MPESPPTHIFISYARADLTHLEALEAQLSNLKRQKRIIVWTDQGLEPGAHWEPTLLKALREAQIILLLVTPDFMKSSFIHDVELEESFKRLARGDVRIIPVMVRPTDIKGSRLDALLGVPRGFQAVTRWRGQERVHLIARELLARRKAGTPPALVEKVMWALPQQSLTLMELAEWVTQRSLLGQTNQESARRAAHLNNHGVRLSALGRREEALQATQDAATLFRRLAGRAPDAFLPNLAASFNNLGIRLSDLGRLEEALQATLEAVTLYRRLAEKAPGAFLPNLAGSLHNLGIRLSALGRREEALLAAQ